ncbi:class I adenylate-forming enzyme family protein [Geomicrobium sediminis]|uniref:Acyl-CoA synthetase (AMP-forming)/AMP-acid ligase II n=2 Tax=Geomicrobium TaxID=767528 RepID=A0ABS2P6Y4_9BACL|nr:AMP-binding protein [Geomicrobium sediminis]MBM7631149.1 acyl-CoA synthetase (AMP-forming)/AMP-acid ligase II [Geomicrobium sediminis]
MIYSLVKESVTKEEDPFVHFEGEALRYSEVLQRADGFAQHLVSLGINARDRVAWLGTNHPHFIVSLLACSKLNVTFVPLNYRGKYAELQQMVEDSGARVIVSERRYRELADDLNTHCRTIEQVISAEEVYVGQEPLAVTQGANDDLAYLIFTSGTTSQPKPVMITSKTIANFLSVYPNADSIGKTVSLLHAPNFHIAGLLNALLSLVGTNHIAMLRQFDARQWLQAVEDVNVTKTFLAPTMMKLITDTLQERQYDLSSLQSIVYGSAKAQLPVLEAFMNGLPEQTAVTHVYGMTETLSTITLLGSDVHDEHRKRPTEQTKRRIQSVGKPLPDVEIQIWDSEGQVLPANEVGTVVARTSRTMQGYYNRPEATAKALQGGWYVSSDAGYLDEEGYLYVEGRLDDMIIRGGENIAPNEIEEVLLLHEGVYDVSVVPRVSETWGQEIVAVIVPSHAKNTYSEKELQEHVRQHLSSFKVPSACHFVDELPRNATGKILKQPLIKAVENLKM